MPRPFLLLIILAASALLLTAVNSKHLPGPAKQAGGADRRSGKFSGDADDQRAALDNDVVENSQNIVLVDPEMAPPDIKDKVMKGYRILMETQIYAKEYAGDKLNCRNCHFQGGNTLGGRNGSISLVGVSYIYPKHFEKSGKTISLAERVNGCFKRSLNGKPLPLNSDKMEAIVAYLDWISLPARGQKEFPWLGLPDIKSSHKPNAEKGKEIFEKHCSCCHGQKGEGLTLPQIQAPGDIPPLWGGQSFNHEAGMRNIECTAPFILLNMPFQNPTLTEEEALDVSQFIIDKPRP